MPAHRPVKRSTLSHILKQAEVSLDDQAKRQLRLGLWQRVRIEFEFQSRSFHSHGHDAAGCDLIVCWEHNWQDCPLEVLELKTILPRLA